MDGNSRSLNILIAEDDEDYYLLAKEALAQVQLSDNLRWVKDGEEAMEYLLRQGQYAPPVDAPRPDIILLDLNMPKKDGREILKEIKANPDLVSIPIVVLTTSREERDVIQSYQAGANSFIRKPLSYNRLVEILKAFRQYWLETVELPKKTIPAQPSVGHPQQGSPQRG